MDMLGDPNLIRNSAHFITQIWQLSLKSLSSGIKRKPHMYASLLYIVENILMEFINLSMKEHANIQFLLVFIVECPWLCQLQGDL